MTVFKVLILVLTCVTLAACDRLMNRQTCPDNHAAICQVLATEQRVSIIVSLPGIEPGDVEAIQAAQNEFLASQAPSTSVTRVSSVSAQVTLETDLEGFLLITNRFPDVKIALDEIRGVMDKN